MANQFTFGGYNLPPGLTLRSDSHGRNPQVAGLPRADGAKLSLGYLKERRFQLSGGIWKSIGPSPLVTDPTSVRSLLDTLRGKLNNLGPANLSLDPDRYFRNVQLASFTDTYEATAYNRMADLAIELVTGDPFAYEVAVQTFIQAAPTNGQVFPFTAGGNATALPVFSFTVAATGNLALSLPLAFTVNGAFTAGDVIVVDGLNKTVQVGAVDKMATFDGIFPAFLPTMVNVTVNWTVGAGFVGISNFAVTYSNRWF